MKVINTENTSCNELINALIDHFNIRKEIEVYKEWCDMSLEDLIHLYKCVSGIYDHEDYYDE